MSARSRMGVGGGMVSASDLPQLRSSNVSEDDIHHLRNENLALKKQINGQEDKTKKLLTKVTKLSEDLRKTQISASPTVAASSSPALGGGGVGRGREAAETFAMMEDMRSQLQQFTKQNNLLKNKVQFFKSLHEAEVRKRAPYDHIPPRVNTGVQRKLYPAIQVKTKGGYRSEDRSESAQVEQEHYEEIQKLEELVAVLRAKLLEAEGESSLAKTNYEKLQEDHTDLQKRQDLDRLTLQRELVEKNKRIQTMSKDMDSLDDKYRVLGEAHNQVLASVEILNDQLKEERRKLVDMETLTKTLENERGKNAELAEMFEDLKGEKGMIEHEYNSLLNNQFSKDREREFISEVDTLRNGHSELEREVAALMHDKTDLLNKIKEMNDLVKRTQEDKQDSDSRMLELQHQCEELQEKLKTFTQDGSINLDELEEALAIVRLRRQKGVSIDFLIQVDDLVEDKRLLQELRVQHAECVQELEKVHRLLLLQEKINRDYKTEVESLNRKIEAMRNEYELRLEEDSRLLDLRSNKVANLEAQLRDILYATVKVPDEITNVVDEDFIEIEHGQNMLEVHVEGLFLSDAGLSLLKKMGLESGSDYENDLSGFLANFTTFVHFDFYEFESQVTPLGVGVKPHFNHTSRFKVIVDDFFLQYLQSHAMIFNVCRSNGLDFYNFGFCNVRFKELVDLDKKTNALQFYADIISTHDQKTIIGKIDYSLRMRIPMSQSIKAFKERTVALNLLTVGEDQSSKRFLNRAEINELVVHIKHCKGLISPITTAPASFCAFEFYQYDDIISDAVHGTTNPVFNYLKMLPVPMTSDLDRYLRTSHMFIIVADENFAHDREYVYGIAKIPLISLVFNQSIKGEFDLKDEYGFQRGSIFVSLEWSKPYKMDIVPIVSSLIERATQQVETKSDDSKPPSAKPEKKKTTNVVASANTKKTMTSRSLPINSPSPPLCAPNKSEDKPPARRIKSASSETQRSIGQVSSTGVSSSKRSAGQVEDEDSSSVPSSTSASEQTYDPRKDKLNQRNAAKQRAEERKHGQEKSSESNADSAKFNQKLPKKKKIFKKNNENDHQDEPHRYSSNGEGSENDRLGHPRSSSSSAAESSTGGSSRRKYSDEAFSEKSSNRESSSSHASDTSSRRRDIAAEVAERRSLTTSRSSSSESLPRSDLIKDEDSDNYDNKPVDNSSLDQPIIKSRALPPAVNKKLDLNASLSRESVKSSSILDEQPKSTPPANVAPPAPSARSSTSSGAWSVSTTSLRPSQSTASAPTETVEEAANTLSSQPAELIFTSSIHQQPTEAATTEADDESSDSDIISKSDLQSSRASEVRNSTRDLPSIIKPPIEKPVSKSSEDLPSGSISPPDDIESVNEAAGVDESGDTLLTSFKQHEEIPPQEQPQVEAAVTIKVSSVSFDVENEIVSTHLQGVKQAFVGFDFLDYPPEELESMSSFMNANGKLNFEFERVFALDKTNNQRQVDRLRSMINSSDPADSVIVFTLVSEPPEDQVLEHEQAAECLDIAVAELHFSDLLSSKSNSAEVTVPVWDLDGEVLLGKLFLSVSGCRVLQALKV